MYHFNIKDIEPKALAEGVEIKVISGERISMVFYQIEPGTPIPEHAHPHEQIGTVLKGKVEVTIGDEKRVMTPGQAYHVPSNVVHSGICLDSGAEVIEVFSPPREDFLKLPDVKG